MTSGLWGYSDNIWQSRTVWTAIITAIVAVGRVIFPDAPWLSTLETVGLAFVGIFLRAGMINDRDGGGK